MSTSVFIITIDTEGDNLWARPATVTTENSRYLPRFQALCERYGFSPTYLVNYEMAMDPRFRDFGRAVLRGGTGEIGLHVHAWDSPPVGDPGQGVAGDQIYLYEVPDELMLAKVEFMTRLLGDVFEVRPLSNRAGRWGFDERVARVLIECGYVADCSVTPGVSWRKYPGASNGHGGPDYTGFPIRPYYLDPDNIRQSGPSRLLEVPMTIRPNYRPMVEALHRAIEGRFAGRLLRRAFGPPRSWLRPDGHNTAAMLGVVTWAFNLELPVIEFMLHSSELMPGGSPTFQSDADIERLYEQLDVLFAHVASLGIPGMTLAGFRSTFD